MPLSHCRCQLSPRPSQRRILDLVFGEKAGEDRLYIVSPPGSGKTITALMIAVRQNVPTVVLVPNTAIQTQWVDKSRFFLPDPSSPAIAAVDPAAGAPITVLTYQALAQAAAVSAEDEDEVVGHWREELVAEGEDDAEAREWIAELRRNNPQRYEASLLRRWHALRNALDREADADMAGRLVTADSLELMNALAERGVGLVVFDECHHLIGYWAQVAGLLVAALRSPRVVGLTATPPAPDELAEEELRRHRDLLHDIDFQLSTPALVREGNLAPYQDLAYFTRPLNRELEFVRSCTRRLGDVMAMVEEPGARQLSAWLHAEIDAIPAERMAYELRRRGGFLAAAARYLAPFNRQLPIAVSRLAGRPADLADQADLVGRFAAKALLPSASAPDRERFDRLALAFRPLGYQLTEKGLRRCQSTVSRVLALSEAKAKGMIDILSHEIAAEGIEVRALVITDFERSSATIAKEISSLLTAESGGAVAAMREITSDARTDLLDPILVTGTSVIVDDDLAEKFLREARVWFETRGLDVGIEAEAAGPFHHIHGRGAAWNTRNYVAMVTELFERGVTRCLVGTRGLLGEGWDSLTANTLIDLTTAATRITVNQLRGRAIRIDPSSPEKVANIWDVVCMAPEFECGLSDYHRFARKHREYYGLCDDGAIEYGLGHIHPALTEAGPEEVALNCHLLNAEMLARSRKRAQARKDWRIGDPYRDEQVQSLEIRGGGLFAGAAVLGTLDDMRGFDLSADQQLHNICQAVIAALAMLDRFENERPRLEVTPRADGYFRIFLDHASANDMHLFTTCIEELFQPIDQQKYIIPRMEQIREDTWLSRLLPEILARYAQRKVNRIAVYHPLPACFSRRRTDADAFSDIWNRLVSPGRAVYTHRGNGSEIASEARAGGQSIADARTKLRAVWR